MKTIDRIDQALSGFATPESLDGQEVRFGFDGGEVRAELDYFDRLAVSCREISFHPEQKIADLKQAGDFLCERLRYLLEPLAVNEIDQELEVVQVRSDPPARNDHGVSYYEAEVRPTSVSVRRYTKADSARRVVSMTLTREALANLVDDLAGLV